MRSPTIMTRLPFLSEAREVQFVCEYPAPAGGLGKVDTTEADEVIGAIAKTVAELTSQQDGRMRQQLIEHLMREIMNYDAEFRSEEATGSSGSIARH